MKTAQRRTTHGHERVVQVCYDAPFSPDHDAVSATTGLSVDAIIAVHLKARFEVMMYGFAPGYTYLSGAPQAIQVPRKPTAERNISAGSVIIAAN